MNLALRHMLCAVVIVVSVQSGLAQQSPPQQQTPQTAMPNAPLELPDFLVTGKAVVDIAAGAKQTPQKPFKLSTADLDSLNPTEKFPTPTVPNRSLPRFSRERVVSNGYLDASFGSYTSPAIAAGTTFKAGDYNIDADIDGLYASNWVPGASLLNAGLSLASTYVAPEKFYLFGKGLTETDLQIRHSVYSLFADPAAPVRSTTSLIAGVATEAVVANAPVKAHVSWNLLRLFDNDSSSANDQRLRGGVSAHLTERYEARVNVDVQSRNDDAYPYFESTLARTFGDSTLRLMAVLGAQYATSTASATRLGVLADVNLDYEADEVMSYGLRLRSGLRPVNYAELVRANPYINATALVDLPYDVLEATASLKYHPTQNLQAFARVSARQTARTPCWQSTGSFQFELAYQDVTWLTGQAELQYNPTHADLLLAVATLQSATTSQGLHMPYVEPVRVDVVYQHQFGGTLQTRLAMQYVGKRFVDIGNTSQLDAFLNVQVQALYAISSTFDLVLNADNLTNSTIILWNGYRERGIFVSGGVSMRF